MTLYESVLKNEEKAIFALRCLYEGYGYSQYKMSKFEEYDLYVKNKDFLISDSVITFTDRGGKLMALKPDVTLSILKNGKDAEGQVQKVYYNENVYRVAGGNESFKEIMQVGLECIGDIDSYCLYETLMLAAKSLATISDTYVLDISHLGVISAVFDAAKLPEDCRAAALKFIGEKNLHELSSLCASAGIGEKETSMLRGLVSLYGAPSEVLPKLRALLGDMAALKDFAAILEAFKNSEIYDKLRIDFSVVHDIRYYNGIVFKGFIEGIPEGVLSGGQYDKLLAKMGRRSGAIGFAVYLDLLERMSETDKKYDVDILLLYEDGADVSALSAAVASLSKGASVMAQKKIPEKLKYAKLMKFDGSEAYEV